MIECALYSLQPCLFIDVRPPSLQSHTSSPCTLLPPPSLIYFLPSFLPPSINSSLTSPPPSPFLTSASSAGYHCTLTQTITSSSRTMISGSDQPPSPSAIPPPPVCRFVITGVGFGIIDALFPPREVAGSGVVGIVLCCMCVCACVKEISM